MTLIKGILLPIRAEYLVRILNGEKTQELRDSLPKDFKEGWIYLYCTKAKPYLVEHLVPEGKNGKQKVYLLKTDSIPILNDHTYLNGKVVARFWFDEYSSFEYDFYWNETTPKNADNDYWGYVNTNNKTKVRLLKDDIETLSQLCLTYKEVCWYKRWKRRYTKNNGNKVLFSWHIKQLEIFAKPKELKDFYVLRHELVDNDFFNPPYWRDVKHTLTRAPQSWQYVYTKEKE